MGRLDGALFVPPYSAVVYYLGRAVQLIGMAQLGIALYRGYVHQDVKGELWGLGAGVVLFLAGRLIERRFARP